MGIYYKAVGFANLGGSRKTAINFDCLNRLINEIWLIPCNVFATSAEGTIQRRSPNVIPILIYVPPAKKMKIANILHSIKCISLF